MVVIIIEPIQKISKRIILLFNSVKVAEKENCHLLIVTKKIKKRLNLPLLHGELKLAFLQFKALHRPITDQRV